MYYNNTGTGLFMPTPRGVVFSPMMSSFGGGSIRGFGGGGAAGGGGFPVITQLSEILSNVNGGINGSNITHNGYGFMLYSGFKYGADGNLTATMDVSGIDTIRFVLMGGGGGASQLNVISGAASGGIEGLLDVSEQTTLYLSVGSGGKGSQFPETAGKGGTSSISFGSTIITSAEGGRQAGGAGYTGTRSTTTYNGSYVTVISRAAGGLGGASRAQSEREPLLITSPTLSGAYAHGASAGQHGTNLAQDVAFGYGGGGGGTHGSTQPASGGPLGYKGGLGTSGNGTPAEGPSVSSGTSFGKNSIGFSGHTHPHGGGGGGAFGAPGIEIFDVGEGATGLVKIWWSASDGDAGKLSTVGNLYN